MVLAKPGVSESLKETRDKDSSLAAALKTAVFYQMLSKSATLCFSLQSRALPILSKRPEIKDSSLAAALKRWFSTRCLPKVLFCVKYAKPCDSDSLKETRDKDSSLAAALKTVVLPKPCASDSLKETRDKDSSLAAALKR